MKRQEEEISQKKKLVKRLVRYGGKALFKGNKQSGLYFRINGYLTKNEKTTQGKWKRLCYIQVSKTPDFMTYISAIISLEDLNQFGRLMNCWGTKIASKKRRTRKPQIHICNEDFWRKVCPNLPLELKKKELEERDYID